ncbi:MAG: hypothetical protein WCD89_27455 [Anaerocolumna sp.]
MKEKKPFIFGLIVGITLIVIGLMVNTNYYSILILAMGFGFGFSSIVQLIRISYYQSPTHQSKYENKKKESYINSVDERKQFLRAKSGQITYQFMAFSLLILDVVLALLRVEAWVIGMIFILFILQWVINSIVYHYLERRQ